MMNTDFEYLEGLIDGSRDCGVDFGYPECELVPTEARVRETELVLGCKLPPSYIWYVRNYGGGEVYGEEIYSIYPELSDQSVGDICYQTKLERASGFVSADAVIVSTSLFGEVFYMDSSMLDRNGEFPVFVKAGEAVVLYANSFADFLRKRIEDDDA